MKRSFELNTKTFKVQKKYDIKQYILWGCHQNRFQVNRRERGTIQKKMCSIKACEFNCCIKIQETDNMSVYVQTFSKRLKAALFTIDRQIKNGNFSKINIMRVSMFCKD